MQRQPCVFGVDIGTESLRTELYTLDGSVLASADCPYPTTSPHPNRFEQNPQDWWIGMKTTIGQCLQQAQVDPKDVIGIGFTGTSCTVAPVDSRGEPLRPAIMWMDTRAYQEAQQITALRHPSVLQAGGQVSAEWLLPKAMWIKKNEPQVWQRTYKLVEGPDYLIWKLSGQWTAGSSSAVGKRHWVRSLGGWPLDMYEKLGMPEMAERNADSVSFAGEPAAQLSRQGAEELGLLPGIVLTNCGPDGYAAMVGMDALSEKKIGLIVGSSNVVLIAIPHEVRIPGMWGPWLDLMEPGRWMLEGGQLATGSILRWFVSQFGGLARQEAAAANKSVYAWLDQQAEAIPPGSDGLIVLDYWRGNRTPYNDAEATGVIWGLTLGHSLAHVYRAILEGTAFGAAHTVLEFRKVGLSPERIVACGGGTKSNLWMQIYADACDLPIQLVQVPNAVAFGAAVCTAVAAQRFDSLQEAATQMVKVGKTIEPRGAVSDLYRKLIDHYIHTYEVLKSQMHEMAHLQGK